MHRNQWKTASVQLLKHWRRSGVTQIPAGTTQSVAAAITWLEENDSVVFDEVVASTFAPGSLELDVNPEDASRSSTASIAKESGPTAPAIAKPILPANVDSLALPPTAQKPAIPATKGGKWNAPPTAIQDRQEVFDSLNAQVMACRKCEEIVCRRQRTVFGAGAINARVVMFGEAPGADEDRVGEPFIGAAGQLLDKILIASGLKRAEVYIVNALKCRPPNNRTPTDAEIENCRPFFETQLETIQPEYIVCWGSVAVRAVLGSTDSVGRLRGKFHSFRGAKVLVTYHPAYLLRTPDAKKLTWEDMKMLMQDMGIPIPGKS